MERIEKIIEAAKADQARVRTITRGDGSMYEAAGSYGIADDGQLQVYLVPVTARTRAQREHFRVTFYVLRDGLWKRTSKQELAKDVAACQGDGEAYRLETYGDGGWR